VKSQLSHGLYQPLCVLIKVCTSFEEHWLATNFNCCVSFRWRPTFPKTIKFWSATWM